MWGGQTITQGLKDSIAEILANDQFIVPASPNVSQHGINWGESFPNVINVGAWNVDQDNYILFGEETNFQLLIFMPMV